MLRYMLIGFTIYFGYRFLFEFLLPLIKTTRQVKKQFDAVKKQQQEYFHEQTRQQQQRQPEPAKRSAPTADDDYIDFEEIK